MSNCIELTIFLIGAFFLIRWFWRLTVTVNRIYRGTPVTVDRYGPKGSWAVVTGATDGIGKAIATELAAKGFNIALIARNIEKLNSTAKALQSRGVQTRVIVFDFREDSSLQGYQGIASKLSDLDVAVLVNNVGIGIPEDREIASVFCETAVNSYPVVLLTQQLLPKLIARQTKGQRSLLINLASQAALMPLPTTANYSAGKVFDDYFTKGLYYELRAKGVDVLSVLPGMVATPLTGREPNPSQGIITSQACAKGILDKATSFATFGGTLHEVTGLVSQALLDLIPPAVQLYITSKFGEKVRNGNVIARKNKKTI